MVYLQNNNLFWSFTRLMTLLRMPENSDIFYTIAVIFLTGAALNKYMYGKEFKKQEFSFKAPALQDFWHIGAQLTDGLGVCLVIGNENTNVNCRK